MRYSCAEGGQRALELHRDGAVLSFSVLLNDPGKRLLCHICTCVSFET